MHTSLLNYLPLYIETCQDSLVMLRDNLLYITDRDIRINSKALTEIYRIVHIIKSRSLFMGFMQMGELAADLEKLLGKLKDNSKIPDAILTQVIKQSIRSMELDLESIKTTTNEIDLDAQILSLKKFI
ncbi:hypothetical protein A2866_05835 [Candidatus Roizmanbacteria bacterium RIFCSPHIGHO2_01_FULL_39_8]|uniref:HPt domain-containing protein n=3 Tax=Candidatus Roizmaniibacteriota TaxID=1752723 RepID=A0A1F7GSG6_9BACT|nr:MAG: hypothetical protein A2866_05835 [Candidatus Roizmanbacteria bacterium RIFCSPHIGHO2_01_FULL_39_8]OGK27231.1 MAG: hypothetical protein A3C28_04310 [Candidatus Roizmanbacteria bacterium RIFCSPHIGHO2_02_FULL_39_9]OGK35118.1 MAG: hypothetical protein A3F60_02605 [Candidatus Roizmanbacteria bacterium RIFCSPHIGHO2_12_FULL_39_8]